MPNPRKRAAPDRSGDSGRMARTKKRSSVLGRVDQLQSDNDILLRAAEILQAKGAMTSGGIIDALRDAASSSHSSTEAQGCNHEDGDTSIVRQTQESVLSYTYIPTTSALERLDAPTVNSEQSRPRDASKSPPTSEESLPGPEIWPDWCDIASEWRTPNHILTASGLHGPSHSDRGISCNELQRHGHMTETPSAQEFLGPSIFPADEANEQEHPRPIDPHQMMLLNDPIAASLLPASCDSNQTISVATQPCEELLSSDIGVWEDLGSSPPSEIVPRGSSNTSLRWERESGRRFRDFSEQVFASSTTSTLGNLIEIELSLNGPSSVARDRLYGRFESEEKRQETCSTRKSGACLRCKMQRIRCLPDPDFPDGACRTCREFSKLSRQTIHKLPCLRYKLTETVLFRRGHLDAQPRLKWSNRWATIKMTEITEWATPDLKTIQISLDLCPEPFVAVVRQFVPMEGDILQRKWTDGKTRKSKDVPPYAIQNMEQTALRLSRWIKDNVDFAIGHLLDEKEPILRETYSVAKSFAASALPLEERLLVRQVLELWFAIRQTTKSEFLVGKEMLGMTPELKDRSYPLFGKVPIPPVMGLQIDIMLTLNVLIPLRKTVLESLQQVMMSNRPKGWLTMYLCVFVLLHNSSLMTSWCYDYARKHGLKERYAYPRVVEDLHHGAKMLLAHFHYCNKGTHLPSISLRDRHDTVLSELSIPEYRFMIRTIELVRLKEDDFRAIKEYELYEDELYFVSQMFEKDWMPRDSYVSRV